MKLEICDLCNEKEANKRFKVKMSSRCGIGLHKTNILRGEL